MIPVRLGFHALSLWGSTVNQSWMQWARVHCQRRGLPSPSLAALGRSVQDPSLDGVCAMHRGFSYLTSFRNTFEQAIDGGEWMEWINSDSTKKAQSHAPTKALQAEPPKPRRDFPLASLLSLECRHSCKQSPRPFLRAIPTCWPTTYYAPFSGCTFSSGRSLP